MQGRGGIHPGSTDHAGRAAEIDVAADAAPSNSDPALQSAGIALSGYAAIESGGLCACAGHRPRWVRIFSMTAGCLMKAMIRIGPPDWGHSRGWASYTYLINRAHCSLSAWANAGGRTPMGGAGAVLKPSP